MCVIIIKQKDKVFSKETAKTAARLNPDGLGVIWLDTFEIQYFKSKKYNVLVTERPFIAHFRYATVGKVCVDNTHPFKCGKNKNEWLMMNGTIAGLGNQEVCDSRILAGQLGEKPRHTWEDELKKHYCRFVTVNTKSKTFQIYNKHLWTEHDGVWYSKDNVLETHYIAVYGTLKKGFSNYYAYLSDSNYICKGKTSMKYPLVVDGLPYLIEAPGIGHFVDVDIFKVTEACLQRLDRLEGHPNFYKRKQIEIKTLRGNYITCWVYFNMTNTHEGKQHHRTFEQPVYKESFKSYKSEMPRAYNNWYYDEYDYDGNFGTPKKTVDSYDPETRQLMLGNLQDSEERATLEKELDDVNNKPVCIDCFHDLEHDGYGNYHCTGCGEWFTEHDILYSK